MKISKESRRIARELFVLSMTDGRIDPRKVADYSDRLVSETPRGYVQILKEFARLIRLELQRRHAVVESATGLDPSASAQLENELRGRFGSDLTIEFKTSPGLLGGLRVQVGSDVWDGSVFNRLQTLKQQL